MSRPSAEDVRLQLEGGLEVVESARAHYAALESCLSSRRWKRRLRERPEVLQAVVRHEPGFEEARLRLLRRAEVEQWPSDLPALLTLGKVLALRDRLEKRLHQRLGRDAPPTLREALVHLEALAARPDAWRLAPGEIGLLQGRETRTSLRFERTLEVGFLLGIWWLNEYPRVVHGLQALFVVLFVTGFVLASRRRGTYWLTRERLLWRSWRRAGGEREVISIPLRSILQLGVQARPTRQAPHQVVVTTEREEFSLNLYEHDARDTLLLSLLELHRHPPLLGVETAVASTEGVCFPVTLKDKKRQEGYAVLRPGYLAFLPMDRLWGLVRAITGVPTFFVPKPDNVPVIVEHLLRLSPGEFDECVARAVGVMEGKRWSARELSHASSALTSGKPLHLWTHTGPRKVLRGKVDERQRETAGRILAVWARS